MYGDLAATIKKKGLLSLSISDWKIEIPDEPKMETYRSIFGLFKIESNGKRIAKVWDTGFIREIYTVDIEPGQNDALILAITSVLAIKILWRTYGVGNLTKN